MLLERNVRNRRRTARPGIRRSVAAALGTLALVASVTGCGSSGRPSSPPGASAGGLVERLADLPDATGTDVVAVWICDVPLDTTDPTYEPSPSRLALTADDVVERAGLRLAQYFGTISHGAYTVSLVAGGTIEMSADDDSRACVDRAIDAQVAGDATTGGTDADVVLAVATAEHTAVAPGGWGTAGAAGACGPSCTLATSRRAAYVGASDFHPDWGAVPALDLMEHELGHTLGLPHSGDVVHGEAGYTSALDLMSDSAAPRDVEPTRLDGPDILGIDRVALGWMLAANVEVVDASDDASTVTLAPSTGEEGVRLVAIELDDHRIITVELLPATGYDAHLPVSGVAVHLVDDAAGDGTSRVQQTLGDTAVDDGLLVTGDSLTADGWTISVDHADAVSAQLSLAPADASH